MAALEASLPPLRIGLIDAGPAWAQLGRAQRETVVDAGRILEGSGHRIELLPASAWEEALVLSGRFFEDVICAALAGLAEALDPAPTGDDFEPMTWAAIARGRRLDASRLVIGAQVTARVSHFLAQRFEQYHSILMPMLSGPPPRLRALPTDGDDIAGHFSRMAALAPYATLANATGLPAISVPHGRDHEGLPLAIQILGPLGSDVRLLQLARLFERFAPWSFPFQHPPATDDRG